MQLEQLRARLPQYLPPPPPAVPNVSILYSHIHVRTCLLSPPFSLSANCKCMLMSDEERRKKEASMVKQTTTAQHTQGSHFSKKNMLPRVGFWAQPMPFHYTNALPAELPRQLSWLGPNLHSTPDEQAYYHIQLISNSLFCLV